MPQERKFESDAERQKAYRERKRLEQGQLSPQQPLPPAPVVPPAEADSLVRPGPRIPTEEEYVRAELAVTRMGIEKGWIKTRDAKGHDLEPLKRSEAYLRWRYRGFRDGSVASL